MNLQGTFGANILTNQRVFIHYQPMIGSILSQNLSPAEIFLYKSKRALSL